MEHIHGKEMEMDGECGHDRAVGPRQQFHRLEREIPKHHATLDCWGAATALVSIPTDKAHLDFPKQPRDEPQGPLNNVKN